MRALLLANLIVMSGAFLWFGLQSFRPKLIKAPEAASEKIQPVTAAVPAPAPMSLLEPAPDQALWFDQTQIPTFTWSRVTGPGEYQFELSTESDFKNILAVETVSGNSYRPSHPISEGQYFWRILSINNVPLAGPGRFSISLIAPLELKSPTQNATIEIPIRAKDLALDFTWPCKPGARSYQMQISHKPAFKPILHELKLSSCALNQVHLGTGKYFWRVKVESPALENYPWSETGKFAIQRAAPAVVAAPVLAKVKPHPVPVAVKKAPPAEPPKAPIVEMPKSLMPPQLVEAKAVFKLDFKLSGLVRDIASLRTQANTLPKLRWKEVKGANSYLVEISRTADFTHIIQRTTFNTPYFEWEKVSLGRVYWRVAAIGEFKGPYSATGQLDVRLPTPALMSAYSYTVNGFEWESVPMAEKYIVQWSTDRTMANAEEKLTDRAQVYLNMDNGSVYVRVAAANRRGEKLSDYSRVARVINLPAGFHREASAPAE